MDFFQEIYSDGNSQKDLREFTLNRDIKSAHSISRSLHWHSHSEQPCLSHPKQTDGNIDSQIVIQSPTLNFQNCVYPA